MADRLSNIDLMRYCDNFPYAELEPQEHQKQMSLLYTMIWQDEKGTFPIGYMLESVLETLKSVPEEIRGSMTIDTKARTVYMFFQDTTEPERTSRIAKTTHHLRTRDSFSLLRGWRDELWPVHDRTGSLIFSIERAAMGLFGNMRYGVHMTAYVSSPLAPHGIKMWIPKRAASKSSFPGMFDNTVAGGLMTGEEPFECMIREADEEASLPEAVVRTLAKEVGVVKYVYITDSRSGGEAGYIYPECQWVYDLELPDDVIPTPKDGEVESFCLLTVNEVKELLAQGRFKPNCAVITLDFFVRHGILTRENEPNFDEIQKRLMRIMPFPGPHEAYE